MKPHGLHRALKHHFADENLGRSYAKTCFLLDPETRVLEAGFDGTLKMTEWIDPPQILRIQIFEATASEPAHDAEIIATYEVWVGNEKAWMMPDRIDRWDRGPRTLLYDVDRPNVGL
jgi:hypothetical protein